MALTKPLNCYGIAATFLILTVSNVHADYIVNAKFTGVGSPSTTYISQNGGSSWSGALTGNYTWQNLNGSGSSFLGNSFETFCIEIRQNIGIGSTYQFTLSADIESLPKNTMGTGMGETKAQQLGYFINAFKESNYSASVKQAVIWNIVNENTLDSSVGSTAWKTLDGTFRFNSQTNSMSTTFSTTVNAILQTVYTNYSSFDTSTAKWNILGLTNPTYQDQIVIVDHQTYLAFTTPAPAGLVLGGLGLVFLGGYGYLRKRKAIPVA